MGMRTKIIAAAGLAGILVGALVLVFGIVLLNWPTYLAPISVVYLGIGSVFLSNLLVMRRLVDAERRASQRRADVQIRDLKETQAELVREVNRIGDEHLDRQIDVLRQVDSRILGLLELIHLNKKP